MNRENVLPSKKGKMGIVIIIEFRSGLAQIMMDIFQPIRIDSN
jgi:hypothetical protein